MAFPKYQLVSYQFFTNVQSASKLPTKLLKFPPTEEALEDEIAELRVKMQALVSEEMSFTSPAVVAISSLLDEKINEYMRLQNNKSRH